MIYAPAGRTTVIRVPAGDEATPSVAPRGAAMIATLCMRRCVAAAPRPRGDNRCTAGTRSRPSWWVIDAGAALRHCARMPARRRSPRVRHRPARPLFRRADFGNYLEDHAGQIAPADVRSLLARAPQLRERARVDGAAEPGLRDRVHLALQLLADHDAGTCPQIPYRTVSLLAAALFYYLAPVDVIPDVLPGGTKDDALVLYLAFEAANAGVTRYLAWKGLAADALREPPAAARRRARRQ